MNSLSAFAGAALLVSSPTWAGFINGNFETGDTAGWTTGGGERWSYYNYQLDPASYLPGGSNYSSNNRSAVVGPGIAPHTDGRLNQVYSGNYSFRAEDTHYGGYASVITQRVDNYTDANIYFAWAAVLEGAHSSYDAATFKLVLRDETLGSNVISREYNAASGGGGVDQRFTLSSDGYFYTDWQIEQLAIDQSNLGHDFTLTLLAADCQPTGHAGYVYLDGFGAVTPPVDPSTIPLPGTLALMAIGGAGLCFARKSS